MHFSRKKLIEFQPSIEYERENEGNPNSNKKRIWPGILYSFKINHSLEKQSKLQSRIMKGVGQLDCEMKPENELVYAIREMLMLVSNYQNAS